MARRDVALAHVQKICIYAQTVGSRQELSDRVLLRFVDRSQKAHRLELRLACEIALPQALYTSKVLR